MIKHITIGLMVAGLALPGTAFAQKTDKPAPTVQRAKLKDCAARWREEKAKNRVRGRAAYTKFMTACLDG